MWVAVEAAEELAVDEEERRRAAAAAEAVEAAARRRPNAAAAPAAAGTDADAAVDDADRGQRKGRAIVEVALAIVAGSIAAVYSIHCICLSLVAISHGLIFGFAASSASWPLTR